MYRTTIVTTKKIIIISYLSKQSNKNVLIIQQYSYYNIQYNKLCSLSIIDPNPPVRCIADRFVEFDLLL